MTPMMVMVMMPRFKMMTQMIKVMLQQHDDVSDSEARSDVCRELWSGAQQRVRSRPSPIRLRACYEVSSTDIPHLATSKRTSFRTAEAAVLAALLSAYAHCRSTDYAHADTSLLWY